MKYTFSFKEINYGSIEIKSDATPTRAEVIDAIQTGGAFVKDTEYGEIQLVETERFTSKYKRQHER